MSRSGTLRHAQGGIEPATLRLPDDCSYLLSRIARWRRLLNGSVVTVYRFIGLSVYWFIGLSSIVLSPLVRVEGELFILMLVSWSCWEIVSRCSLAPLWLGPVRVIQPRFQRKLYGTIAVKIQGHYFFPHKKILSQSVYFLHPMPPHVPVFLLIYHVISTIQ